MAEIGQALRAARMSARIDVSEIEAETKIRAKYLRALENEEWDLLPGPTFVRSFLRTYAQALGLDAKVLVEEYRLNYEHPSESALEPIVSTPRTAPRGRGPSPRPSRAYSFAIAGVGLFIVLLIVLLVTSGGPSKQASDTSNGSTTRSHTKHNGTGAKATGHSSPSPSTVSTRVALSLRASAAVYVCLIDNDDGHKLIPGLELQPGESTPTFHAKRFTITLGNSSVTMFVDGIRRVVAPSSAAIGYSITKAGGRRRLKAGQLPTCT
jgi:cytoskeleton protein RodZ